MRISDWSSDVCSSDLLGGCVHDQFLSIRKGRLRPGSKPPWGERVLKAGLVVGSDGQAAAVLRHRVAASSAVSRSEEHTSELQSLMRISYAGFCLTQKTQNLHICLIYLP